MEYVPRYIIVHHTAANTPTPQFDAINEWHRERDFAPSLSGFYVGYHRVIEKDGTVRVARTDTERDCDALGHNFDSLSVALVGNFDEVDPAGAQVYALGAMLREWTAKYRIDASQIFPHRHFAAKSCYGSRLNDNWAALVYLNAELSHIAALISALQIEVH